jgi:hypothetical protein
MRGQQFANRGQRRKAASIERQTGGTLVDTKALEQLHEMQRLFLALVRREGRVRVEQADLDALREGDSIKGKMDRGTITITFEPAQPAEGAAG